VGGAEPLLLLTPGFKKSNLKKKKKQILIAENKLLLSVTSSLL
jgi:hypothetical protein